MKSWRDGNSFEAVFGDAVYFSGEPVANFYRTDVKRPRGHQSQRLSTEANDRRAVKVGLAELERRVRLALDEIVAAREALERGENPFGGDS